MVNDKSISTSWLLNRLSRHSETYVRKSFRLANESDLDRIKHLFDDKKIDLKGFRPYSINIIDFDWTFEETNRNWWWQLQSLPFLRWYINCFDIQSQKERLNNSLLCLRALLNWVERAQDGKSPLAWHDHATAFRLRNIVDWLVFCHIYNVAPDSHRDWEDVGGIIIEHLDWLTHESNYSEFTNHGFDQAVVCITAASLFSVEDMSHYRDIARKRIEREVKYAFTPEGVHKENSPGYQKYMLSRLSSLSNLRYIGEKKLADRFSGLVQKANRFLEVVTLPNGVLPSIGDTRAGDKGLVDHDRALDGVFDYTSSGYFVARGVDQAGYQYFLLLKNQHDSNYHRHDDDMSVFLWYRGEVLIGDSGLFNYQEKSSKRQFIRSCYAHSIPFVSRDCIRKPDNLPGSPSMVRDEDGTIRMQSYMFGVPIRRAVRLSVTQGLIIEITDSISDESETSSIAINFVVLRPKKIVCKGVTDCRVVHRKSLMDIYSDRSDYAKVITGWNDHSVSESSIVSLAFNKCVSSSRIQFGGKRSISFTISVKPR